MINVMIEWAYSLRERSRCVQHWPARCRHRRAHQRPSWPGRCWLQPFRQCRSKTDGRQWDLCAGRSRFCVCILWLVGDPLHNYKTEVIIIIAMFCLSESYWGGRWGNDLRNSVRSSQSTLCIWSHLWLERLNSSKTRPSSHSLAVATPFTQT